MTKEEKLEYIVQNYTKLMHGKAFSVLQDSYEAEDACQEAFLKLYRVLDRVSDVTTSEARSYCVMTAKNAAVDIARKLHHETPVEEVYDAAVPVFDVYPSDTADLLNDIEELPQSYKDVIRLRCFEELAAEEAARELDTNVNTVNLRLFRARKILEKKWLTGAVSVLLVCGILYLIGSALVINSGKNAREETAFREEAVCEETAVAEDAAAVIPETVSENTVPGSGAEAIPVPGTAANSAPDYVTSSVSAEEEENTAVRRGLLILFLILLSVPFTFLIRRSRKKEP